MDALRSLGQTARSVARASIVTPDGNRRPTGPACGGFGQEHSADPVEDPAPEVLPQRRVQVEPGTPLRRILGPWRQPFPAQGASDLVGEVREPGGQVQVRVGGDRVGPGDGERCPGQDGSGVDALVDQVHGRTDQLRVALRQRPVAAVHPAVAGGDPGVRVDELGVHRPQHGLGDDPRAVDDHDGGRGVPEEGDGVLPVDRPDRVDGDPTGGVQPRGGHDLVDPASAAPPQVRQGRRDEEHLADHGGPSDAGRPAGGHRDPGGGVLDHHDELGHAGRQVVRHDVGGVAGTGEENDRTVGARGGRLRHYAGARLPSRRRSRELASATAASWERTPSLRRTDRMWERTVVSDTTSSSVMSWAAQPSVR